MSTATLTARIDKADKLAFDNFCSSIGITSSAAINMYIKAVLREHRIPFELKVEDPFYSPANQAYLLKSVAELRSGMGTEHELLEDDE